MVNLDNKDTLKDVDLKMSERLTKNYQQENDIAVIGIGLKVSNAETLEGYWEIFDHQIDCIRDMPQKRIAQVENYARIFPMTSYDVKFSKGTYLEHIDEFDYPFFKVTPREAELMEPAHRILLQTIYNTFVDAGYSKDSLAGTRTGVFIGYTAGSFKDNYLVNISFRYPELIKYALTGNMPALMPSRISQLFDLHGPTMILDTACSSSLLAVHQACESIHKGSSEMAIAGGIKINLLPVITDELKLGIESDDDRTRTFDNAASGTGIGEGVFCVLLKSLKRAELDKDHIYGVIKASSINHDGTASGLTAPNPSAQTEVIVSALEKAGMLPEDISYVEVHGTATILGDPIEFQGLAHAYRKYTNMRQFCALSASKSNLGHLYECAGIAALVKALAALNYKKIPGTKYFNVPNLKIDFSQSPFYVNCHTKPWLVRPGKKRTCGVSAFGLSGTNCHVILQEYIQQKTCERHVQRPMDICCVSAFSEESLKRLVKAYRNYINESTFSLDQIIYNINVNHQHYKYRLAIVFSGKKDLLNKMDRYINNGYRGDVSSQIYASYEEKLTVDGDYENICTECNLLFSKENLNIQENEGLFARIKKIAQWYTGGGEINWINLYYNMESSRLSLPGYPFERYHMWLTEPERTEVSTIGNIVDSQEAKKIAILNPLFYQKVRLRENLVQMPLSDSDLLNKQILVFRWEGDEFEQLTHQLEFCEGSLQIIELKPIVQGAENYLFEKFVNIDYTTVSKIIFYFGKVSTDEFETINDVIKIYMLAIINLCRCIEQVYSGDDIIRLFCLTQNGFYLVNQKDELQPEYSCILGVCKALNRGIKHVHALCIDIDRSTQSETIKDEIFSDTDKDIVFYRNNMRYIEGLKEVTNLPKKKMIFRNGGVYLITGGLGGIGFEVAKELSKRTTKTTIVLLGRTILPAREKWSEKIAVGDVDTAEKLKRLSLLEKQTNKVVYYVCDVSQYDQVLAVIDRIQKEYGKLNGIIHAAGVGGGTDFENLHEERISKMISAKIVGAYALDKATEHNNMDFFISFSSISTVFSSIDLADYIAANVFLEEFASWRSQKREGLSLTVAWATWAETGMSVKNNFTMNTIFKSITTQNGIQALFQVMDSGLHNLIVGHLNFESKIILLIRKYPLQLSPFIEEKLQEVERETHELPKSTDSKGATYIEIENQLCAICCRVLGYSSIEVMDNFFELGADSIMLGHIYKEIDIVYPNLLNITDLFAYPTVAMLTEFLLDKVSNTEVRNQLQDQEVLSVNEAAKEDYEVAIIGVGMELPNATNLDEYWDILNNSVNVVRDIPQTRSENIVKHLEYKGMHAKDIKFIRAGYLDRINIFDYAYFGMAPKDCSLIEPAGRLFLKACAVAIEDAGYGGESIRGTRTGVFLGYTANIGNAYSRLLYEVDQELFGTSIPINQVSMMASRIAYTFDLKGPSMVIDTACSSSLVSLHIACEKIRNGECDMALAGGASIMMTPLSNGLSIGFESSEYKTRAFADNSSGTAVGEGVCAILLKSLKQAKIDGDSIYAVIKGSAINQDGRSQGIAAPNYLAQSEVIIRAWKNAGVTADDISYIEAHGTGTQLGDPIEIKGINHAFMSKSTAMQVCGIGSLKTNIGHLNEASGMSGVLKIILMLKHKIIPASLGFGVPNLNIDFAESPVYVVSKKTELKPKKDKIIVGINGFGMSGTNCHVIIQEAPSLTYKREVNPRGYIFTASAKTKIAFCKIIEDYIAFLSNNKMLDLSNFCYTANVGRTHFPYRLAVYVYTHEELINRLKSLLHNLGQEIDDINKNIGYHNIVPESKSDRQLYDITARMQKQMSLQAANILNQMDAGNYSQVDELITLYVNGATVNWLDLYKMEKYRRIHIPVYPFEQSFCWYKIPQKKENILDLSFHYEKKWIKNEVTEFDEEKRKGLTVVLLGKDNIYADLPEKLKQAGREVCVVHYGNVYHAIDINTYCVGHSVEDYTELFRTLKNRQIIQIIHMKSIFSVQPFGVKEINDRLDDGFFDVIALIKGMAKAQVNLKFDLILIANLAYSINKKECGLLPVNATLLSVGKVIEQENPNINCFAIDTDLISGSDFLCKQILYMNKTYLYGIRNNEFYQMESKRSELTVLKDEVIKAGQVYLVTGGTSGIGVEIANYISLQNPSTIILISRSGFAPKENWEQLKKAKDCVHQINIFEHILSRGCMLCFETCDVSNMEALSGCIDRIHKKYGSIRGIFHSAGISGAGYILRKDRESFMQVLRPKIFGTLYLDQLTADDDMDFMMLCSSAVTDSGEAGQSDYVAANAFIDAFTDYRNAQGRDTYTVNWVSWKETGMSVRHGINVDGVTKALTTKDAIQALDKLLRSSPRRVMIGQYNQEMDLSIFAQYSRCKLSDELSDLIMKREGKDNIQTDTNAISNGNRDIAKVTNGKMMFLPKSNKLLSASEQMGHVVLRGDSKGIYTETEHLIGDIYSRMLGYEEINVYDNFFELGGDSIMLSSMYDLICIEFEEVITVADLFEYTNIRDLAKLIQQNLSHDKKKVCKEEVMQHGTELEIIYPLSQAQKRIYYDSRLNKNKLAYNNPFLCDLTGMDGNIANVVVASLHRHEILRTRFCIQNGKLMQKVGDIPNIEIETISVNSIYSTDYNAYLKQFDLMKDYLFKLTLFIDKKNNKMLLFDVHHIILDGFSSGLLQSEMMEYYKNHAIVETSYQYRDFVSYEQQYIKTKEYQRLADYWIGRLNGYNPDLHLGTPQEKERIPAYFTMTLDEALSNNMHVIASSLGQTVFSIFLFIINLLTYVEWEMDDIVFLAPTLNREKPQFKKMLGVFINLIPLRNQINGSITVKEQMIEIFSNLQKDLQHQSYQYNDLIDCLKQHHMYHKFNMYVDFEDESLKSLKERDITFCLNHLKYDFDIVIKKRNNLYDVEIAYDNSIFAADSIEAMAQKIKTVIAFLSEYIATDKTVENLKQKIISVCV